MAVTSGFFNSLNGDRKYNAEQMSSLFDGIINDGIFSNIGSAFMVTADNANTINIGIGRAWFDSTWVNNDAILPLTLDGPEVILDRIDAVVIEINKTEAIREGRIVVVKGTPSSSASRPELANADGVYQHPIAYIYRKAEATAITQADITNMVGTSECPYITAILQVQSVDNIVAQWESQFNIWFDGLQTSLEGDVAANLASQVSDLQDRFTDLAQDKAVYEPLQDSDNDYILDSSGRQILGATVFAEKEVIGEGTVVVNEDNSFEVGDTLTTARSSPGAEWLLCNGEAVSREDYPELSLLFPDRPDGRWQYPIVTGISNTSKHIRKIIYANGYYVGLAAERFSGGGASDIAYSTSISGPWTVVDVSSIISTVFAIKYVNGYFMLLGQHDNTTMPSISTRKGCAAIRYGTDITNVLNFSRAILDRSNDAYPDDYNVRDIIYIDGQYVAIAGCADTVSGVYELDCRVYYCATLSENDRDWKSLAVDSYTRRTVKFNEIRYINDKYYIFGYGDYGSDDDNNVATIWYSSTLTGYDPGDEDTGESGYWTKFNPLGTGSTTSHIEKVYNIDGVYVMLTGSPTVILCSDITVPSPIFETITLPDDGLSFVKYGEYYIFSSGKKIMFSNDIHGSWSEKDLELNTANTPTSADLFVVDSVLHSYIGVRDESTSVVKYAYLDSSVFDLPVLVGDRWTRVFIKALE